MPITQTSHPFSPYTFGLDRPVARKVRYVDSTAANASNGNLGDSWFRPLATIEGAFSGAYAAAETTAGTVIYVAPGHTETITAAAGIDADIAGVSIVGLGNGTNRPTITFTTATTADIDVDAANITIENMRFACGIASQVAMIDVNAAGCTIKGCEFVESATTGLTCIDVSGAAANACDKTKIQNNRFYCATAGNWDRAIELGEISDGTEITDNIIIGDFDDAGIHNVTGFVLTNLMIARNYVRNNQSGQHAIELVSACTGTSFDNRLVTDALATSYDAGALSCMNDIFQLTTGGDFVGVPPLPTSDTATNFIGVDDSNNVASTSSVAANQDGSVLERLEQLQQLAAMAGFYNSANYIAVTADFTSATWNTEAAHEIATITGAVKILILPESKGTPTSAGSGATLILGDETTTNSIIASSDAENLATGEWWADATITRTILTQTLVNGLTIYIGNGKGIGYTVGGEALTGGSVLFHMWWVPLDATGNVAAGAGGAL